MPVKRLGNRFSVRRRHRSRRTTAAAVSGSEPDVGGWLGWIDRRSGLWGALQLVALVVAGAWAVFLLLQSATERRIDNALQYATQLSEGRTGEARHLLDEVWYSQPQVVSNFRSQLANLPPEFDNDERENLIRQFVGATIMPGNGRYSQIEVTLAIADIAGTLDQIALCATECEGLLCWRGAQCHEATSRDLFCGYARSFHLLYGDVLGDIRETYGNVQLGVDSASFARGQQCEQ